MQAPASFDFDGDYGEIYDHIARTVIPGYLDLFPATLAVLRERIGPEARVLVVGCGTGSEVAAFAPAEPGWRITGVDPSEAMIAATRRAAEAVGAADRVELRCGEVDGLDRQGFQAATVINVLHFLPDDGAKAGLVEAVAQRLAPGGTLALFDLHGDPASGRTAELRRAWSRYMALKGLTGPDLERFLDRIRAGIAWVPESRILEICRDAGLSLDGRYFAGLLYGGWTFTREAD